MHAQKIIVKIFQRTSEWVDFKWTDIIWMDIIMGTSAKVAHIMFDQITYNKVYYIIHSSNMPRTDTISKLSL